MSKNIISQIKERINIVELAVQLGAEPVGSGLVVSTKHNPIRDEKTSSLKLYSESNSFHDFGSGESGDVIDFYAKAKGLTMRDAIFALKDDLSIVGDVNEAIDKYVAIEYMKPALIRNIFSQQKPCSDDELLKIVPRWLLDEADELDKTAFHNIVRMSGGTNPTAVVLLCDEEGIERTMRYRRKEVNGEEKKWVAQAGSQSSVHYTRIKNNSSFTLIVEGTHDYLTAILCGYSVIAIPSARFKINNELLQHNLCVFIDDDDGKNSMVDSFYNAICQKVLFNHSDFKHKINKTGAKDFSDYVDQFASLVEFKNAFDDFILSLKPKEQSDYLDVIGSNGMTADFFENIPEEFAIYDGFIYENQINMIFSDGGQGKSILALAVCNHAIKHDKCDSIIYVDNDNGVATLKNRVPLLIEKMGDKLHYYGKGLMESEKIIEIIDKLALLKKQKERVLIVVDSLLFFVQGGVMADTDVTPFMTKLQNLRDNFGATVILLHHTKKPQKEDKFPTFYGSVQIKNAVDIAWAMIRNKNTITLKKEKGRPLSIHELFTIEIDYRNLEIKGHKALNDDADEEEEEQDDSSSDEENANIIALFLQDYQDGISPTELKKKIAGKVSKAKVDAVLFSGVFAGTLWRNEKLSPKGWKTYPKSQSTHQPQIIEYNDDMVVLF